MYGPSLYVGWMRGTLKYDDSLSPLAPPPLFVMDPTTIIKMMGSGKNMSPVGGEKEILNIRVPLIHPTKKVMIVCFLEDIGLSWFDKGVRFEDPK